MSPRGLALSLSSTRVDNRAAGLPRVCHSVSWPTLLSSGPQNHKEDGTVWTEPLEGWNCKGALLPHPAEYLLCGLSRKRCSTGPGFVTCTRTGVGGGEKTKSLGRKGQRWRMCRNRFSTQQGWGTTGTQEGPWHGKHLPQGLVLLITLTPQPAAAEKILSWKRIVSFQPSRPLIRQETDDPTPSHCLRGKIWGPHNPVPLNKILSRPQREERHRQPA